MFEEIKGQDIATHQLKLALDNPVHTYLFIGSRGTYIEQAARIFASRLIDESGSNDDRVKSQIHPDVIEYEPSGVTYKVKEEVRQNMLVQINKTPIESSKQVLIVHDAHLLRQDSANTMLKSLEEPPTNTHWILIAPSLDSMLPTIKSRSFVISFSRLRDDLIREELLDEGTNETLIDDIIKRCAGRMDRAKKISKEFYPIINFTKSLPTMLNNTSSSVTNIVDNIQQVFAEISDDVITNNKNEIDLLKKEMKDSGYSDKIAQSIISNTKTRIEAKEKKLKLEMLSEFLAALQYEYNALALKNIGDDKLAIDALNTIEDYKKRLVFNPSEELFLESLFASILNKQRVTV